MNDELKQLILDTLIEFSNTTIDYYKLSTRSIDMYGEATSKTYEDPVTLQAVYWHFKDDDSVIKEGRESMDYLDVSLPVKALEYEGLSISDITLESYILCEGRKFGISEIRPTGRAYGDHTVVFLRCYENPHI